MVLHNSRECRSRVHICTRPVPLSPVPTTHSAQRTSHSAQRPANINRHSDQSVCSASYARFGRTFLDGFRTATGRSAQLTEEITEFWNEAQQESRVRSVADQVSELERRRTGLKDRLNRNICQNGETM